MDNQKYSWKSEYTTVLIANAFYILVFYILMITKI